MSLSPFQLQHREQFLQPLLIYISSIHQNRKRDILPDIEHRDQVVELIDQSHLPAPEHRQRILILGIHICSVYIHLSRCRSVHSSDQMEQGRLAGSG